MQHNTPLCLGTGRWAMRVRKLLWRRNALLSLFQFIVVIWPHIKQFKRVAIRRFLFSISVMYRLQFSEQMFVALLPTIHMCSAKLFIFYFLYYALMNNKIGRFYTSNESNFATNWAHFVSHIFQIVKIYDFQV